MSKTRKTLVFLIIGIFIILFFGSTILYFTAYKPTKNITLECKINDLSDLNNVETAITSNFSIYSNEIFVYNSGEIIFDNNKKQISRLYLELIIRNKNDYNHYQLQNAGNEVVLIDFGKVKKENFQPYTLLSEIIRPICALAADDYNSLIQISLDSVVHEKISFDYNSYIYNEFEWSKVSEEINGKYVSFVIHDGTINVNNLKYCYVEYRDINL